MALVEFSQTDSEQFTENNVPLYLSTGAFSCVAPAFIRDADSLITDVTLAPGIAPVPPVQIAPDLLGVRNV
jgi:hypothetical protein